MSQPVLNPMFIAGTPRNSGDVQDGSIAMNNGGGRTYTNYSGAPASADILIWSGAGRLNQLLIHTLIASGQVGTFYDSAVATSGGPHIASGHKILALIPTSWSGAFDRYPTPVVLSVNMPFQSGLCVATRSGVPGFTVSFTPERSTSFGGT